MQNVQQSEPNKRKIAFGASFSIIARVNSSLFGYINLLIIARLLDIESFGYYNFILSLLTICYIIANFGIENTLIYLIPQKRNKGSEYYENFLSSTKKFLTITSTIIILLIIIFQVIILKIFDEPVSSIPLLLSLVVIPMQSFVVYYRVLNQSNYKYIKSVLPENIIRPLTFFLMLVFLFFINKVDINLVIIAYIISFFCSLIYNLPVSRNLNKTRKKNTTNKNMKFDFDVINQSRDFLAIQLFNQLPSFIIVLILGIYLTSESIGYFRASFQTAALIAFGLRSIELVYTPIISSHYNNKNFVSLKEIYTKTTLWMLCIGGLLCTMALGFSEEVMFLFGEEFKNSIFLFNLLAINQLVNASLGSVDYFLMMSGKTKRVLLASGFQVVFVIISGYFFIKYFGLIGAALSIILGTILFKSISLYYCYKDNNIHPFSMKYFNMLFIILLNYVLMYYFYCYLNVNLILKVLVISGVVMICYCLPAFLILKGRFKYRVKVKE